MAVVEIAKIQIRRGAESQTGVPLLDGGEFAWAADTEHLYIGLKRADGGSRDTNIRILTENDVFSLFSVVTTGLLNTLTNYVWESDSASSITTSTSLNNSFYQVIQRTVNNKLDDFVNVADFGVYPSTDAFPIDCSAALQMVIDHLYLDTDILTTSTHWDSQGTGRYNKKLYFQSGIYKIGQTILLPRKTVLIGEGIDKTIIENITTGSGIFQTVDWLGRQVNPFTWGKFDPEYNSAQSNITGSGQPNNIQIEGMTLRYSSSTGFSSQLSLISFDCVSGGVIRDVKLQGKQTSWSPLGNNLPTGINLRGYSAVTSENILIDNCEFNGLYYGILSNYDTNHVVIQNNNFLASSYGIALSTVSNSLSSIGPNYYRAINNKFKSIERQAIYIGTNTNKESHNFISENNAYINVGNTNGGTEYISNEAVIIYHSNGNASINDYFERKRFHDNNFNTSTIYYPLVQGNVELDFKSISTGSLTTSTSTTIMRLPLTGDSQSINVKYNFLSLLPAAKTGNLEINVRPGFPPANVTLQDNYNTIGSDGGIYFGLIVNSSTRSIEVLAVNPSTSTSFSMEFQTKIML